MGEGGYGVGIGLVGFEEHGRAARAARLEIDQRLDRFHQRIVPGEGVAHEQRRLLPVADQEDHAPLQRFAR